MSGTRLVWTGPPARPDVSTLTRRLVSGFLALACGGGFVFAAVAGTQDLRLVTNGQRTTGVVQEKRITSSRASPYQLAYRFTAAYGQVYAGRENVGPDAWRSVAVGAEIPITYDNGDPGNNHITRPAEQEVWLALGWIITGLSLAVVFVFATLALKRELRRESVARVLSAGGVETEAEVTGRTTEWLSKSGTLRVVKYRYRDAMGKKHRGEGPYMYPEEADAWTRGSIILVRYDPDHPRNSMWLDQANWSRSGKTGPANQE